VGGLSTTLYNGKDTVRAVDTDGRDTVQLSVLSLPDVVACFTHAADVSGSFCIWQFQSLSHSLSDQNVVRPR